MLARENRLRSASDFRSTMRLGHKATTEHLVVYLNRETNQSPVRFGFVVGKTVGNAVQRNLVKRRARSAFYSRLDQFNPGSAVVLRALPGAAELPWATFTAELDTALSRLATKS